MPWGPLGPRKRAASVSRWGKPGSAALGALKGEELAHFPLEGGVYTIRVERFRGTTPYVWAGDFPMLGILGALFWGGIMKKALPKRAGLRLRRSATQEN
jgi:hypothetical protein